jgi:energy-converting hydrogenase A subunit P
MIIVDNLKCLRNDYYHNDCQECIESCPIDAIELFRGKIKTTDSCTKCAVCIPVCKTESLSLDQYDLKSFALKFLDSSKTRIVDTIDIPRLDMLGLEYLFAFVVSKHSSIELIGNSFSPAISKTVESSNKLLKKLNISNQVILKEEKLPQKSSLRKAFEDTKSSFVASKKLEHKKDLPFKKALFNKSLKNLQKEITLDSKKVENSCTNCKECITFCPTGAFELGDDQILFNSSYCIECGICEEICRPNAISKQQIQDVNSYFDFVSLISFEYAICSECKCSFIKSGEDTTCKRCQEFSSSFSTMFNGV